RLPAFDLAFVLELRPELDCLVEDLGRVLLAPSNGPAEAHEESEIGHGAPFVRYRVAQCYSRSTLVTPRRSSRSTTVRFAAKAGGSRPKRSAPETSSGPSSRTSSSSGR